MTDEELQERIDEENEKKLEDAQEEYTNESGAELKSRCHELTWEVARRYKQVMVGRVPDAFGEYDRDDISRILNTDMTVECTCYALDKTPGDEVGDDWMNGAIEVSEFFRPDEDWDRTAFIEAFEKYLYTTASFAKSIGATLAMRFYLRAWGLVNATKRRFERSALDSDEALRVVRLERAARLNLWIDVEAAKLPKFKPRKKKSAAPVRKSSKKRKGKG